MSGTTDGRESNRGHSRSESDEEGLFVTPRRDEPSPPASCPDNNAPTAGGLGNNDSLFSPRARSLDGQQQEQTQRSILGSPSTNGEEEAGNESCVELLDHDLESDQNGHTHGQDDGPKMASGGLQHSPSEDPGDSDDQDDNSSHYDGDRSDGTSDNDANDENLAVEVARLRLDVLAKDKEIARLKRRIRQATNQAENGASNGLPYRLSEHVSPSARYLYLLVLRFYLMCDKTSDLARPPPQTRSPRSRCPQLHENLPHLKPRGEYVAARRYS